MRLADCIHGPSPIPPNEHTIDYSIPRIFHVTNADFVFIVANDLDRKILKNKTVFGRRPVSP
jgi:hypothetical protein